MNKNKDLIKKTLNGDIHLIAMEIINNAMVRRTAGKRINHIDDLTIIKMHAMKNKVKLKPAFDHDCLLICEHCGRYEKDMDNIEHQNYCLIKCPQRLLGLEE